MDIYAKAKDISNYLERYVFTYRREYERFTSSPPRGGGYPKFPISPYLYSKELNCYLAKDGVLIADQTKEPSYSWHIAGGPALCVDYEESKTPPEIIELLKREGIWDKPIGIYRIVSKGRLAAHVWHGNLGQPVQVIENSIDTTKIKVYQFELSWENLLERLTFGALCNIIDIQLPTKQSGFWTPHIIRNIGFFPADRSHKRFFHYLEMLPHIDLGAWDVRNIAVRVQTDIRRDFASAFISLEREEGSINLGGYNNIWIEHFINRLFILEKTINDFSRLLDEHSEGAEAIFHEFLKENSILLDVYGKCESKPRFNYPEGESPLGKEYVEPDFVISYPGQFYKLVELERPSKLMATRQGQPRAEVNQATFQIAEWKAYIKNHNNCLKNKYPGIAINLSSCVVMSRSNQISFGSGRDIRKYMELIKEQYSVDEVLTYDDLLERAKAAYTRLSGLSFGIYSDN